MVMEYSEGHNKRCFSVTSVFDEKLQNLLLFQVRVSCVELACPPDAYRLDLFGPETGQQKLLKRLKMGHGTDVQRIPEV